MRAWVIGAVLLAGSAVTGAGAGAGAQQPPQSVSMVRAGMRTGGAWSPALFVCDAIDRDRVLVMSAPDARRRVTLTALEKPGLAPARAAQLRIGEGEAGMSQMWMPLLDAAGAQVGTIHSVSPGVVEPGATTPTVTSLTLNDDTATCRFAPQTRVLGATAKRSIQVTRTERSGYRYRSYDYDTNLPALSQPWGGRDTRASTTIDGGRLVEQSGDRRVYEFRRAGFVYRVLASTDAATPGGGVEVWQAGRRVLAEPFGAYTAALQP
ncbi:hypothetical protein [Sphingomonas corticis]|jgi:hypothetical protein|uniref:Uncharacterized protein n=1 Tax=Sphingomonas corticis TaxID=2722791 RepID=A0ABX1CIU7_9SPHN|nr:hypothetical protein [Sphingomonas corticis]NJR77071.1 hypothetical protein [Sphingomonas corticis]